MMKSQSLAHPEALGALACLLATFLFSSLVWLLFLALMIYTLLYVITPAEQRGRMFRTASVLWLFALLSSLPLMFGQTAEAEVGWAITDVGIEVALRVMLRAVCAFGAVRMLLVLLPFYELCRSAHRVGIPSLLVELMELSYRYIHELMYSVRQIRLAQLSRLGYSDSVCSRYRDLGLLISRTFVLAHSNSSKLYDGLLSRGFDDGGESRSIVSCTQPSLLSSSALECEELLRLTSLSFAYRGSQAVLRAINLSAIRGERIALLGENGAGKSTLMRIISGLLPGYTGEIALYGELLPQGKQSRQMLRGQIALVFQNSNHQLFCPSVEDELAFGLRNLGYDMDTVARLVTNAITRYQLEDIRHRAPHELSEGQKKWVCLASVLVTSPDIILLDEPTAALDRYYTAKVLNLLEELSREGKTIILSTHDMYLADRWAQRAWVMHRGELIADMSPADLWEASEVLRAANLERPIISRKSARAIREMKDEGREHHYRLMLAHSSTHRACIVGAGEGAMRKLKTLLSAGLHCIIIAPQPVASELSIWQERGLLDWQMECWEESSRLPQDIDLVVAATDSAEINQHIIEQASERGLLYCSLSNNAAGNIQFVAQGGEGIRIGVHTDYQLPELAQSIRDRAVLQLANLPSESLSLLSQLRRSWLESNDIEDHEQYESLKNDIINQYLTRHQ